MIRYALYVIVDSNEFFVPTLNDDKLCSKEEAIDFCKEMRTFKHFHIETDRGFISIPEAKMKDVYFFAKEQLC